MSDTPSTERSAPLHPFRPIFAGAILVVALVLVLIWFALQMQVAVAGFLNGESIWSKAQKQSIIDLYAYSVTGDASAFAGYQHSMRIVTADRIGRDALTGKHPDAARARREFASTHTLPQAISLLAFATSRIHA